MGFDIYRKRFILKNQLMQLWCLRSSPLCHLQVRGQEGCCWWRVSSRGQKGPITRGLVAESPALRWGPQLKQADGKPKEMNSSFLCLWFSLGSQWVGCCSPTLGRTICFTQPPNSRPHWKQPTRLPEKGCWAPASRSHVDR